MFKLICEKTGRALEIGETVTDFRGSQHILRSFEPGKSAGSSGRVYLQSCEGEGGFEAGFYPSVIGATIVEIAKG